MAEDPGSRLPGAAAHPEMTRTLALARIDAAYEALHTSGEDRHLALYAGHVPSMPPSEAFAGASGGTR